MIMINVYKFTPASLMRPERKEVIQFLKIDSFGEIVGFKQREKRQRAITSNKQRRNLNVSLIIRQTGVQDQPTQEFSNKPADINKMVPLIAEDF